MDCASDGDAQCETCDANFHDNGDGTACEANVCVCPNGTPKTGADCATHDDAQCASCNDHFADNGDGTACEAIPYTCADSDGDGSDTAFPCSTSALSESDITACDGPCTEANCCVVASTVAPPAADKTCEDTAGDGSNVAFVVADCTTDLPVLKTGSNDCDETAGCLATDCCEAAAAPADKTCEDTAGDGSNVAFVVADCTTDLPVLKTGSND